MTALSEYDPQTHGRRPELLVAPWSSEKRAKDWIDTYGGVHVQGSIGKVHDQRTHHIVAGPGDPCLDRFRRDLMFTVVTEADDCYDEIYRKWRDDR